MRAFEVSPVLEPLREVYPSAEAIIRAVREGDREARYALAGLWLSEGIPYSFKARPGLYESMRRWLARKLGVCAKEITLVGSGRQGFCLTPGANLGRIFGEHSDLDLTVISSRLFGNLVSAFKRWNADYTNGHVSPRNERERIFWNANKESVPSGLTRGFIDPHKIPTWERYPEAQMIAQTKYLAHEMLKATPNGPAVRNVSFRVYRDWESFVRQMAISLRSIADSLVQIRPMPFMPLKIAILGWGSLLWDYNAEFDAQHNEWVFDGPELRLEFSRISESRGRALTLVIDTKNGALCRVAYTFSRRKDPEDAICDLRTQEGTNRKNIGFYFLDGSRQQSRDLAVGESIIAWAKSNGIDVVVWTDLESNFKEKSKFGQEFSVEGAISHVAALDAEGRAKAIEYVQRALSFVDTPFRNAIRKQPWFE